MIIKNKIVTIYGMPGSGKTLMSLYIASVYFQKKSKIFSNVDYFYFGQKINQSIKSIKDVTKIPPQSQKGLVIIDEGGVNINSRRSMSEENIELGQLGMLSRKKNVDIVVIAQLDYTIDKYYRDLSRCSLYMRSYFSKKNYLNFEIDIFKESKFFGKIEIDLFYFLKNYGYTYDTGEESIFEKKEKKKTEPLILESIL